MGKNDYKKLSDISASQWGLITTAQAERVGVSRLKLSRLVKTNQFIRLAHGVYRDAGATESNYEGIKAIWLSTDPALLADERLQNPTVIIGGATATYLWNCGDLDPYPYQFYVTQRRQTQKPEIRYFRKVFSANDYSLNDGLPVARIEYAMAELVSAGYDLSLVAKVLKDARATLGTGSSGKARFNQNCFIGYLEAIAKRSGYKSGEELYDSLLFEIGESSVDYQNLLEAVLGTSQISQIVVRQIIDATLESVPTLREIFQKTAGNPIDPIDLAPIAKILQANMPIDTLEILKATLGESLAQAMPEADSQALQTLPDIFKHPEQEGAHE
jgi:hypothetical protein